MKEAQGSGRGVIAVSSDRPFLTVLAAGKEVIHSYAQNASGSTIHVTKVIKNHVN